MAIYSSTEIRKVRLLIPDTNAIYGEGGDEYIFDDGDIALYIEMGNGNVKYAAGLAMVAVGNSEALIGKVIRNYETETDASKLQKEWRTAGLALIEEAKVEIEEGRDDFFIAAYRDDNDRHPEGLSHGSYRFPVPTGYNW